MPDYSKGKIYTIRNKNDPSLIYVGSTIQSLAKRLGEHRRHSRQERNKIKYLNHQLYTKLKIGMIGILNYMKIVRVIVKKNYVKERVK